MNSNTNSSGVRLRQIRKSFDLTQERMAEELSISVSLYKAMETGKAAVSKRTAEAVEARFGISADSLFYGTLRDDVEVWNQIYECDDEGKLRILFRLINYFMSNNNLTDNEEKIKSIMKAMFEADK